MFVPPTTWTDHQHCLDKVAAGLVGEEFKCWNGAEPPETGRVTVCLENHGGRHDLFCHLLSFVLWWAGYSDRINILLNCSSLVVILTLGK